MGAGGYVCLALALLGLGFGLRALHVLLVVRREDRQRTGQQSAAA